MAFDINNLSAFDNGIEKIFCKHSPGKPQVGNAMPGIHQHREILFVLKGKCDFPLNRKLMPVKPGQVVLIDSWEAHCAKYSPADRNLLFLWFFLFNSRMIALVHEVNEIGKLSYATDVIELPFDLSMTVIRRWNELKQLTPDDIVANVERFMKVPLSMLLDEFRLHLYKEELQKGGHEDSHGFVTSIQRIIEAQNGRNCSLEQLEKYTGFNRFYISHAFKKANGMTIGEYIGRIRSNFFESARKQGLSHKQIAFELGFSNSSSLSTWFRRYHQKKN
ncbi:MAG: helix-turn-helix domain-containing protein [Victivallales bacterium]|nr:helix-turn-helix domain-containing protein [Victivallales bacterium]